jgi:hypothetical protein
VLFQYFIVTFGGEFSRTSPLTGDQWIMTIALALFAFPVGFFMRYIPMNESEDVFFNGSGLGGEVGKKMSIDVELKNASWWDTLGGSRRGKHEALPTDSISGKH